MRLNIARALLHQTYKSREYKRLLSISCESRECRLLIYGTRRTRNCEVFANDNARYVACPVVPATRYRDHSAFPLPSQSAHMRNITRKQQRVKTDAVYNITTRTFLRTYFRALRSQVSRCRPAARWRRRLLKRDWLVGRGASQSCSVAASGYCGINIRLSERCCPSK